MNRYLQIAILTLLVFAVVFPIFYYGAPFYESSPDVTYAKAKVLHVLEGDIFIDPISGYETLHPPLYHILLAPLKAAGLSLRAVLMIATVFSVALTVFFAYRLLAAVFGEESAFLTCLLIPFINDFMGSRSILLASSFYFSVPFFLAGLWLYVKFRDSIRLTVLAAFVWGMAFFISPVYVFLLAFIFLYELVIARRYSRFSIILAVFLLTISPYIIEALSLYFRDMVGSSVFAFWRGAPDGRWLKRLFWEFISPTKELWRGFLSWVHVGLLVLAGAAMIREKRVFWFIPVAALAYLLTFYHFSPQYAVRIHYLLSIFVVATALSGILRLRIRVIYLFVPVLALAVFSVYAHFIYAASYYKTEKATYDKYVVTGEKLWVNLDKHLVKGSYIFCTKNTYRYYFLANYPVHSLGAYRTLEYFQVNPRVAEMLDKDYQKVMYSTDLKFIRQIIEKYDIQTAVVGGNDVHLPLFQILAQMWRPVYSDTYFIIYKKP